MQTNLSRRQQFLAGGIIAGAVLFSTFSFYFYQVFMSPNVKVEQKEFYLYIPTGAGYKTVLDSLKKTKSLTTNCPSTF